MASNFPHGFKNGVTIRNAPIEVAFPNDIWYVNSNIGVDLASSGYGKTRERPFATLDYAIGKCSASASAGYGDIIYVMPGHAETVTAAGGLDLDVAGVTIVGLGNGEQRPTVTFTTATTADMDIDAANISIYNILFKCGIDLLAAPIDVNASDFGFYNCELRDAGSKNTLNWIHIDGAADRVTIEDLVHKGNLASGVANTLITTSGGNEFITIKPKSIDGYFSAAVIENTTSAVAGLDFYADNPAHIRNRNSNDVILSAVATTTGNIGPNLYIRLADDSSNITQCIVGADMQLYDPVYVANADGEKGMLINWSASTDA